MNTSSPTKLVTQTNKQLNKNVTEEETLQALDIHQSCGLKVINLTLQGHLLSFGVFIRFT